jgi:hypothetical protein
LKNRIIIIASYLGLGFVIYLFFRKKIENRIIYEIKCAVILCGLFLFITIFLIVLWTTGQIIIINSFTDIVMGYYNAITVIGIILLSVWFLVWVFFLIKGMIFAGSKKIKWIFSSKTVFYISGIILVMFQLLSVFLIYQYFTIDQYVEFEANEGSAYILFDDMYDFQTARFLGFIFLNTAHAVKSVWNEKLIIIPASEKNMEIAFKNARFIYIAAHGYDGQLFFQSLDIVLEPEYFKQFQKDKLDFIYLSACSLGVKNYKKRWLQVFKDQTVVLFERDSAVLEHFLWMYFESTDVIKNIEFSLINE